MQEPTRSWHGFMTDLEFVVVVTVRLAPTKFNFSQADFWIVKR
jgi:hypothetical protein